MKLLYEYIVDNMSVFSSLLNSFYIYIYGQPKIQISPTVCPMNDAVGCGTMRRQLSTNANNSYKVLFPLENAYPYPLDTCQTVFLVEKKGVNIYDLTILFTRDPRGEWREATSNLIMQRILLTELKIPVLNSKAEWAIIGIIDCQPDRNKNTTGFHQDSISTIFLPKITVLDFDNEPREFTNYFSNFFQRMFPQPEKFNPNAPFDPRNFVPVIETIRVATPTTAHAGVLDYKSTIPIIAAATQNGDEMVLTVLPKTTDSHRAFLFYLNSLLSHSTPEKLKIPYIEAWFLNPANRPPGMSDKEFFGGFNSWNDLKAALKQYNQLYDDSGDYARSFRRFLEKIILFDTNQPEKDRLIAHLKYTFYKHSTTKDPHIGVPPVPFGAPPGDPPGVPPEPPQDNQSSHKRKGAPPATSQDDPQKKNQYGKITTSKDYTYFSKRFSGEKITQLRSQINIDEQKQNVKNLSENPITNNPAISEQMNLPFQFSLPRAAVHGGRSKRNKSRRRNTKKRHNKNKRRKCQRKSMKRRK